MTYPLSVPMTNMVESGKTVKEQDERKRQPEHFHLGSITRLLSESRSNCGGRSPIRARSRSRSGRRTPPGAVNHTAKSSPKSGVESVN